MAVATPAVTVLIPAYNAGLLLRQAVDSILAQTFTDFECLVIDDGSTDGAVAALRSINDPRLCIAGNERNLGLIATLNRGLQLARAPLLARMDADDVALPERLALQVQAFNQQPGLALLGGAAHLIDEHGRQFGMLRAPVGAEAIRRDVFRQNAFVHPAVMFRTDVVRAVGGYSASAVHVEDYELWLRVLRQHAANNLAEPVIRYRVHPGQISQKKMAAQRVAAARIQAEAWAAWGREAGAQAPHQSSLRNRLTAAPGTLGADYLSWARLYNKMNNRSAARATALRGLAAAPLSLSLFKCLLASLTGRRTA